MTVIAALLSDDGVYMGADSGVDSEFARRGSGISISCPLKIEKVRELTMPNGEVLVWGTAGLHHVGQWIERNWRPSNPGTDVLDWLQQEVAAVWRTIYEMPERMVLAFEDEDTAGCIEIDWVIGVRGRVFSVDGYGSVDESADDYQAVGSGSLPAAGALFANSGQPPGVRIREALEAAAHHHTEIQPPFTVKFAPKERVS